MGDLPAPACFRLSLLAQTRLLFLGGHGLSASLFLVSKRPGGSTQPKNERSKYGAGGGESELVPPNQFLEPILMARRTSRDWLVVQVTLNVHRQAVGGLVTPRAILFKCFHYDPIEVAAYQLD